MSGCDCLKNIYRYVRLLKILSWVGVTGCDWVWMGG